MTTSEHDDLCARIQERACELLAACPNDVQPEGAALIVREAQRACALLGGEPTRLMAGLRASWMRNKTQFSPVQVDLVNIALQPDPEASSPHATLNTCFKQWNDWSRIHHREGLERPAMDALLVLFGPELDSGTLLWIHRALVRLLVDRKGVLERSTGIRAVTHFQEAVRDLLGLSAWRGLPEGAPRAAWAKRHQDALRSWQDFMRGARADAQSLLRRRPDESASMLEEIDSLMEEAEPVLAGLQRARPEGKGEPDGSVSGSQEWSTTTQASEDESVVETKQGAGKR